MAKPDLFLVRRIARRLSAALEIRDQTLAETQIESIMEQAVRSKRRIESTFSAVQVLRDLRTVDYEEAAWLFHSLFEARQWYHDTKLDKGTEQLITESPEQDELIMASIEHNDLQVLEAFYRRRGEDELADLVRRDPEAYDAMLSSGYELIFIQKDYSEGESEDEGGTDSRMVMERILALASIEKKGDMGPAWLALLNALREVTPAAALAAIREAQEIGAIDFEERMRLTQDKLDILFNEECCGDREYVRLRYRSDMLRAHHGLDEEDKPDEELPFDVRMAQVRLRERQRALVAVVLRRAGEHRIANMLVDHPEEYERIMRE